MNRRNIPKRPKPSVISVGDEKGGHLFSLAFAVLLVALVTLSVYGVIFSPINSDSSSLDCDIDDGPFKTPKSEKPIAITRDHSEPWTASYDGAAQATAVARSGSHPYTSDTMDFYGPWTATFNGAAIATAIAESDAPYYGSGWGPLTDGQGNWFESPVICSGYLCCQTNPKGWGCNPEYDRIRPRMFAPIPTLIPSQP